MTTNQYPAPAAERIVAAVLAATDAERFAGIGWYPEARAIAAELDPECPERAAAVMAVLSPMTRWDRNVWLARVAYAMHAADVLGNGNVLPCPGDHGRKAARILSGEAPASVVKGDKVTAFWRTITEPTDPNRVVVDRHALDVAIGQATDDTFRARYLSSKRNYAAVADMYRHATAVLADTYGMAYSPAQVQAVAWVAWRNALKAGGSKRKRKVSVALAA